MPSETGALTMSRHGGSDPGVKSLAKKPKTTGACRAPGQITSASPTLENSLVYIVIAEIGRSISAPRIGSTNAGRVEEFLALDHWAIPETFLNVGFFLGHIPRNRRIQPYFFSIFYDTRVLNRPTNVALNRWVSESFFFLFLSEIYANQVSLKSRN